MSKHHWNVFFFVKRLKVIGSCCSPKMDRFDLIWDPRMFNQPIDNPLSAGEAFCQSKKLSVLKMCPSLLHHLLSGGSSEVQEI